MASSEDKIAFCMTCQKDKEIPNERYQRQAITTITGEQQKCAKSEDHITISKEAAESAKKVWDCLEKKEDAQGIQIVLECKETLRWRNAECRNWTLIHKASSYDRKNFLSAILQDEKTKEEALKVINAEDSYGRTALFRGRNNVDIVRILLDSNAIIDNNVLRICDESHVTEDTKKKVSNTLIKRLLDTSNSDVSPTDFQENVSKWNWILQSASVDNLLKALQFLKEQNEESYEATTAKITATIEPAIKSASFDDLVMAFQFLKQQKDTLYDNTKAKIAVAVSEQEHAMKSASYDDLIKALHLFKHPDDNIYDDAAGKIAAALATHHICNLFDENMEDITYCLKTVASIRALEDIIKKGLKQESKMKASCKKWFLEQFEHQLESKSLTSSTKDEILRQNHAVFETYVTVKALYYLSTNPPEINNQKFSNIQETLLDYSNKVTDNKLQTFIQTNMTKNIFEKSSKMFSDESQYILLKYLVLLVVGKSENFPSTTKLVFDFVKVIENKKQFLEDCFQSDDGVADLISCILLQVKGLRLDDSDIKNKECNCSDEKHQLLVEWLNGLYEVKDEVMYQQAYNSLAVAFLSAHRYEENVVADCVQRQKLFRKDENRNRAPILQSLTSHLPVTTRFGTLSSWLSFAVTLTILSSLFYMSDFGSDVYLGLEYKPKFNNVTCSSNDNGSASCVGILTLEQHNQYREAYLQFLGKSCSTNSETFKHGNTTQNSTNDDERDIWATQPYFVNGNDDSNICLEYLRALNLFGAFTWTFIFISATILYHYFLLFWYHDSYDPMVRFYLGWCCDSKLSTHDKIKFVMAKILIGILLPYLTILYNNILMPSTLHQIKNNREKIIAIDEVLNANSALQDSPFYSQYPIKDISSHFCPNCKPCSSPACFCPFCGFFNHNRLKVPTTKEYQAEIKKISNNLQKLGGLNRLGEMTIENTYLPFIQCIMGLLQMIQTKDTAFQIFTSLSVASSVFSMSTSMSYIHYSIESKQHLSQKSVTKFCFILAMIFQICSRMITISFMGMYTFPYYHNISWIILACVIHIFLVLISKLIVYRCYSDYSIFQKETLFSITLSAFSSVYTNTRIGKIILLKGLSEDSELLDDETHGGRDRETDEGIELGAVKTSQLVPEKVEVHDSEEEIKPLKDKAEGDLEPNIVNLSDDNESRVDSRLTSIKRTRQLIRKEYDYKLADRLAFTTIIVVEQVVILLAIKIFPFSERINDSHINIFYCSIIPLFIIGQLLEAIYHTYLNPEAKYRQRMGCRKYSLTFVLLLLFLGGLIAALYFLYDYDQMGYFIIILTIIVVLTLSSLVYVLFTFCCARD